MRPLALASTLLTALAAVTTGSFLSPRKEIALCLCEDEAWDITRRWLSVFSTPGVSSKAELATIASQNITSYDDAFGAPTIGIDGLWAALTAPGNAPTTNVTQTPNFILHTCDQIAYNWQYTAVTTGYNSIALIHQHRVAEPPNYPGLGHENDDTTRSSPQHRQPDDPPPPAYEEIQASPTQDEYQQIPVIESVTFGLSTWPGSAAPYMALNKHWPSNPERKRMDMVYKIRYGAKICEFILYWYPPPVSRFPDSRRRRAEQRYLEHFEDLWMESPTPEASPHFLPVLRQLDAAIIHTMMSQEIHLEQSDRPWKCQIIDQFEDPHPTMYAMVWTEGWADYRHREVLAVAIYNGSDVHVIHEDRPGQ
ncbi:hypothetical protein CSIM01_03617 [Colletotrichum simmondsii]|uniref:Uncharacterized protein n=1 Tax=Colletotrichum simmondsii TaxID=703756 RepID=A0A135RRQ2_9PEZI|nr:hypothetical protein CSIM01_03617 [Colletotrichum simmondsii]